MIASRPSLLTDRPHLRPPLEEAVEVGLSTDELTRAERDQFADLHYALRIADR
ncbi:hypothetical protein ABZ215_42920 [Amycolatopsis sp. NPDC006131]|uniref:hypothetical protein n=1 Tax=Amycolatopsis sp. NPDC006131 TaxID=3156731 RepID=UPI0033ACB6D2